MYVSTYFSPLITYSSPSTMYTRTRMLVTRKTLPRMFHQIRGLQSAILPDLPYSYKDLEPVIDAATMRLHHQTYVTNYNRALEQLHHAMSQGDSSTIVELQSAINFNSGGGGEPPRSNLDEAINKHFGSATDLIHKMTVQGAALQGPGWVWLGVDKEFKRLVVETTQNQDPLVTKGATLVPLLGIDVWEHAYYLKYKNLRAEYLQGIWKVINWRYASDVYDEECCT